MKISNKNFKKEWIRKLKINILVSLGNKQIMNFCI